MVPTKPVVDGLELYEDTLGGEINGQPQFVPLHVLRSPDGRVMSRWTFTPEERKAIADGSDICLLIYSGQQQYPPTCMYVIDYNKETHNEEHLKSCMLLDDFMEIKLLREQCHRANEESKAADEAFGRKIAEVQEKLSKFQCHGSSSPSGQAEDNSKSS